MDVLDTNGRNGIPRGQIALIFQDLKKILTDVLLVLSNDLSIVGLLHHIFTLFHPFTPLKYDIGTQMFGFPLTCHFLVGSTYIVTLSTSSTHARKDRKDNQSPPGVLGPVST